MQVKQLDPDVDVQTLDDDELLMAHTALHSFYREFQIDEEVEEDRSIEDWDEESVVQVHEDIRDEMEDREIPHQELSDLDDVEAEQSSVSSWVADLVQADDPESFIQSNPPEMGWYLDAIDEVEQIDASIDIRDYVTLSAIQVDDLDSDSHPVAWLSSVAQEGLVGYTLNEDTETGVVLAKQGDEFSIVVDDEEVYQSEKGDVAYSYYEELSYQVEQDATPEEAAEATFTVESDEVDEEVVMQGEVLEGTDIPEYQWYVWEQQEAENWLMMQGFDPGEPEQEGEFLSYEIADSNQFATLNNEWRGPWFPPETFVQGFDARPVLLTVGKVSEEETEGQVQSIKFQVESPPELPQQSIDEEADWYWYRFNRSEARQWLKEQDIAAGEGKRRGPFLSFEVEAADRYDSLDTVWEGAREPTDTLAGGEKPRRVTYGVDDGEERGLQAIEFLVEPTVEQKALQYVEEHNVELEETDDEREASHS